MKNILLLMLISTLWNCSAVKEKTAEIPSIHREAFLFAVEEGKELFLDRIIDSSAANKGKRPVFIYSFGGAWEAGQRNENFSTPFLEFLARKGYIVAAIDYRLWIKEIKARGGFNESNARENYIKAIDIGVQDLFSATSYILRHADEWNIDTSRIIIGGASAGAINSLKAEYLICNNLNLSLKFLPRDFNYAGVVSMAGALWLDGADKPAAYKTPPCPHLFFHGSNDQVVTYNEAHAEGFSGYGPAYLYNSFSKFDYPVWFYDIIGGDHLVAMAPLVDYHEEINTFFQKFITEKQKLKLHTIENSSIEKKFANMIKLYGKFLQEIGTFETSSD